MKVIFLDFDGVLNSAAWWAELAKKQEANKLFMSRSVEELDPSRVKMISDLALELGAVIVISSSWRILHILEELQDFLLACGMDQRVLPIDVTPALGGGYRGEEVRRWIERHPEVTNHVIFDDDGDFYPYQPLVKTTWDGGLTEEHIDIARGFMEGLGKVN